MDSTDLRVFLAIIPSSETQGQSVGSGERARRKFSSTGERAPGYRLSPSYFQKFKRMPAPDWAQKMLCIIVPNRRTVSPEFFSWVRARRQLSCHTCPVRSPRETFIFYSPNQKRRNYRWVKKTFGMLSFNKKIKMRRRRESQIQPPPQALRFSHGKGERETIDWWWTARDQGQGTDGRRSACQILCRFLGKKSRFVGMAQFLVFLSLGSDQF